MLILRKVSKPRDKRLSSEQQHQCWTNIMQYLEGMQNTDEPYPTQAQVRLSISLSSMLCIMCICTHWKSLNICHHAECVKECKCYRHTNECILPRQPREHTQSCAVAMLPLWSAFDNQHVSLLHSCRELAVQHSLLSQQQLLVSAPKCIKSSAK